MPKILTYTKLKRDTEMLWDWILKWSPVIQSIILVLTAFVVAWYTVETSRIRKHMKDQLDEMVRQTNLGQTPHIIAWCRSKLVVYLVNVGNGPALHLTPRLVRFDTQTNQIADHGGKQRLQVKAGRRTGYSLDEVKVVPYLLPQPATLPKEDFDGTLEVYVNPDDDRTPADNLLEGVNAIWLTYQDTFQRHYNKVILLDANGDYLRQVDRPE